jgi:hypothetical protein
MCCRRIHAMLQLHWQLQLLCRQFPAVSHWLGRKKAKFSLCLINEIRHEDVGGVAVLLHHFSAYLFTKF